MQCDKMAKVRNIGKSGHITHYPIPEPEKPAPEPKKPEPAVPKV
jgi:hypothetical protein